MSVRVMSSTRVSLTSASCLLRPPNARLPPRLPISCLHCAPAESRSTPAQRGQSRAEVAAAVDVACDAAERCRHPRPGVHVTGQHGCGHRPEGRGGWVQEAGGGVSRRRGGCPAPAPGRGRAAARLLVLDAELGPGAAAPRRQPGGAGHPRGRGSQHNAGVGVRLTRGAALRRCLWAPALAALPTWTDWWTRRRWRPFCACRRVVLPSLLPANMSSLALSPWVIPPGCLPLHPRVTTAGRRCPLIRRACVRRAPNVASCG